MDDIKDIVKKECTDYLLNSCSKSKLLKEQVTILEYENLQEWIKNLSCEDVLSIVILNEQFKNKIIDKMARWGAEHGEASLIGSFTLLGGVGGNIVGLYKKIDRPKTSVGKYTAAGAGIGAGIGSVLSVIAHYRKKKIEAQCLSPCIKSGKDESFCKKYCKLVAHQKYLAHLKSELTKCPSTKQPEKCKKELATMIRGVESEIVRIKSK